MNSAASMGTQSPDDTINLPKSERGSCRNLPLRTVGTLTPSDEPANLKLLADDALADRIRFYAQPANADERRHLAAALVERGRRLGLHAEGAVG